MKKPIARAVAELPAMSRPELLRLWHELFDQPASEGMRRELLIPCLAYRLQEHAYGGPTLEQRMELRRATQAFGTDSGRSLGMRIKPGTRILRKWREEMHEVLVTKRGYEYRGVCYKSLSVIARQITHTRWSGPAFFGLNKPSRSSQKKT
jgi:hypothetical protein